MEKFTDMTPSKWDQIDFTKVIAGESPFVSWINNRPYPALRKYQIKTIVSVDKAIIVAGSNSEELMDENHSNHKSILEYVDKNVKAHLFRSTDGGQHFEKIILGRGEAQEIRSYKNRVYVEIYDYLTKKINYMHSNDWGKSWKEGNWYPIQIWEDGTVFVADEEGNAVRVSQDNGQTWHVLNDSLNDFYLQTKPSDQRKPLAELSPGTLVGMTENKEILLYDLKTKQIQKPDIKIPDGKKVQGFIVNNHQLGVEVEDYSITVDKGSNNEYIVYQSAYFFPDTGEYVRLPKQLPEEVKLKFNGNYIGGVTTIDKQYLVHVYTLTRGKQWFYQVLYPYYGVYGDRLASAYIQGEIWFHVRNLEDSGTYFIKSRVN